MRGDSIEHTRRRGFTLVELMVVMVLMGIMAATIIPEMRGTYEDALLRGTSRELLGVFSTAASRAISVNQVHRLRIDLRSGKYALERPAHEGEPGGDFVVAREVSGSEGRLDARIAVEVRNPADEAGPAPDHDAPPDADAPRAAGAGNEPRALEESISFYPDGTADAREILLQDRQGFRLVLRINAVTSRVNVVELKHE